MGLPLLPLYVCLADISLLRQKLIDLFPFLAFITSISFLRELKFSFESKFLMVCLKAIDHQEWNMIDPNESQ